ncbi:MAG: choice-of-anchor B family protein [Saprospiraceae bacterium]|nr:choice-of-anchor B family protein [Lewinellaceae bacterium]
MKKSTFLLLTMLVCASLFAQNTNVAFRSKMSFPGQSVANVWGYAANGREYALVGASQGLIIVDITNPDAPQQIVQIPGPNNLWKEIKTYRQYAYIVSEGGQGVQVIDMSNLPAPNLPYHYYTGDGPIQGQLGKIHALHIDVASGFLYAYGGNLFSGGAKILNLNGDPYNPKYAGKFDQLGYIHDGFVDNDTLYAAHIYQGLFSVVDLHDKSNPNLIETQNTPNNFTHNTWPSDNRKTLFTTDETNNSYLAAYDISNLDNITLLDKIQSNPGSNSAVHNTHILGNFAVTAWYKDGFTIVDITRPDNLVQVGNYDTYPNRSGSGYDGCWGVYPYFPSGNILASTIRATEDNNGEIWILSPNYVRACYLEGAITNGPTGTPLNGVSIEVLGSQTEQTAANGVFKMGQEKEGYFTVRVSKPGFQSQEFTVYFQRGVVRKLNTALYPTGGLSITGTVRSAYDNSTIADATVTFSSWSGVWETTTDSLGTFAIPDLPAGLYDIVAGAAGFGKSVNYKMQITADQILNLLIAPKTKSFLGQGHTPNDLFASWPNPFLQEMQVSIASEYPHFRLRVFNSYGKQVLDLVDQPNDGLFQLGADWPAGVYLLQLDRGNGMPPLFKKVVKGR